MRFVPYFLIYTLQILECNDLKIFPKKQNLFIQMNRIIRKFFIKA
ncbi:hypothetical protein LEP1GSC103_0348 [Leptospira borgpetersenii serovar Javanica str. UI 09931]|uniref:Uncharacterized protein n=5 Tax=Leptospira borgpetersenii TaxID=174 RepID=M3HNT8_LEPBO|nr:hypothetical protein LBBP_03258 [Leptospira borgpetersenii serovar Ballum]ANH01787.1 Uncharacterized protein LB4E_2556 [Leptospira borgpetersenii str. 4E]EKP14398.1 hypothetical protein LEP1GSC128_1605 [Leptospira borgpetersenii str. 200801926]EKQ92563.1 hypothetical protein LEP1GSC101_2750 [Leptospira borgpetersenii str. UI 09149]EKQ99929.1 hypothetical protein LEP1GSC121_2045 [Leptospira borgpetersenii serovar Castellonis str. 200801910]EMF99740.1 hypothetical protein LEP1GSC123_2599 [Lep